MVQIAYAPDENYIGLTVVSMVSVLDNSGFDDIEFIILHSGLSNEAVKKLEWVKSYKNCKIKYIEIDRQIFSNYPLVCWVTISTWFRTKIADLYPECEKVLYLDSDTLVRGSLKELFEIDLKDNYVATVNFANKRLSLKSGTYFNAGVILINCKIWREENVFQKIDDYVMKNNKKIACADQDVLNIIADTRKLDLPEIYNYCENYIRDEKEVEPPHNTTIVHFVGPKPNSFKCINSFKFEWITIAMKTPCYNEFVSQNIYNIITSYPKLKRNSIRYEILSKITLGKTKQKYLEKAFTTKLILNSLKN